MENTNNLQEKGLDFGVTVAASFIGCTLAITAAVGVGIVAAKKMKGNFIVGLANVLVANDIHDIDNDMDDVRDDAHEDGVSPVDVVDDIDSIGGMGMVHVSDDIADDDFIPVEQ